MAKRSEVKKRKASKKSKKLAGAAIGGTAGVALARLAGIPAGAAAGGLALLATQMKKGSALANFLKEAKTKGLQSQVTKGMSPGPKKKRKLGDKRAVSPGPKKKRKVGDIKAAERREAGRGKVGPKRLVVKDSKGNVIRDKQGKAIKRLSREELAKRRKANR